MSLRSRSDDDEKEKLLLLKGKPRHIEGSCELLDESEQDKIIDDLKQEAYSQSQWNREVFHYLYLAVSMLYVVCMYYTYQIPYSMGHQRIFEDVVQIRSFYVFYTGSVYCSIVAAFIVKRSYSFPGMMHSWTALLIALLSLVYWSSIMWRHRVHVLSILWLPLGNLCTLLLSVYIDRDTNELVSSVERMDAFKYNLKSV